MSDTCIDGYSSEPKTSGSERCTHLTLAKSVHDVARKHLWLQAGIVDGSRDTSTPGEYFLICIDEANKCAHLREADEDATDHDWVPS